jgi:hypothetical protein
MPSFDPLDREILERAFDAARAAVKNNDPSAEFERRKARGSAAPPFTRRGLGNQTLRCGFYYRLDREHPPASGPRRH